MEANLNVVCRYRISAEEFWNSNKGLPSFNFDVSKASFGRDDEAEGVTLEVVYFRELFGDLLLVFCECYRPKVV